MLIPATPQLHLHKSIAVLPNANIQFNIAKYKKKWIVIYKKKMNCYLQKIGWMVIYKK